MENEICIGTRVLDHGKGDFLRVIDELRCLVTHEKMAEFNEELTTENLRDIVQGGKSIYLRMTKKINSSIKALLFPAEKRQKQDTLDALQYQFTQMCLQVRKILTFHQEMPIEAYVVEEDGTIGIDNAVVDSYFNRKEKILISHPQQIEVYNLAKLAVETLEKLSETAGKYGMMAGDIVKFNPSKGKFVINPNLIYEAHDGGILTRNKDQE